MPASETEDGNSAGRVLPLFVILIDVVVTLFVFPHLPPRIPVHWNVRGQIDGHAPRELAAIFFPLFALVLWLLMRALPRIDPRRANYASFAGAYDTVVAAVVTLLAIVHVIVLAAALGVPIAMNRIMPLLLGGLFVVLGSAVPHARPNWWFGVRTPWTLSNDRVWARTQRVSGHLMIAAGIVAILSAFLLPDPVGVIVLFLAITAAGLGSVVYSYFAWKQETSQ